MSETFSVRIPKELKEKIQATPNDWNQEIQNFLTERIKQLEIIKTLDDIQKHAQQRTTKTDSVTLIREEREKKI
ncbi:MAG: hypothetical protein NWE93_12205 [Candidatus Bathyarchaeota archaeon]|nr:hypothetical protein [Candidatus Bathyarchaeota archaeon]